MGKKALVIVESPSKIKTLKKFLGKNFHFESSVGHVRDLPQKEFGIDVEHSFEPKYVILPDKKEVVKKLKSAAKEVDEIFLSPDPDREGEAIAWHIASFLPKDKPIKRVTFHSITKSAVLEAFQHPRDIDQALVDAQQARRLLDRIVGYKISPILAKKIRSGRKGTSAGRVQSVALKLVVDREREIENFIPVEYWNITAILDKKDGTPTFEAYLYSVDERKIEREKDGYFVHNQEEATSLVERVKKGNFVIKEVEKKEKKRNPTPPFITSTLQQEASRHFGFAVNRTMSIAQSLYEGIDLGEEGAEGLITYMRTDSVQVAPEGLQTCRDFIGKHFGQEYLPETPRYYTSKKSAQEAHEAIRPTNMQHPPDKIKAFLSSEQYKLYSLIWKRFIASQMNSAIYDTISADIDNDAGIVLRANGSVLKFDGFLAVYEEKRDKGEEEKEEAKLPDLNQGEKVTLADVLSEQAFTKPPPRFTEASLVKELEKSGIGRPSTYGPIMGKIQSREYTIKENQTLRPTDLGKIVAQMLEENFSPIMNVGFTAAMEDDLELVAENKVAWRQLLENFWKEFFPMVEKAEKEATVPRILTRHKCPKCGNFLQKIWSKNKYFYGCSKYPECPFTSPIELLDFKKEDYDEKFDWDQKCPKCGSDMVLRHGRFGAFLGCSKYPECKGIVNIPKKGENLSLEDAPNCPAIGCGGKIQMRRSRFGKIFYSCSNFPDCDVIVNAIDELEEKYDAHHPKTAYVKKARSGKRGKGATAKYKLSPALAKIVGAEELSRGDVLKKLWEYIKLHGLQDPKDKRLIVPDDNLEQLFGNKEPLHMMKLAKVLSKHMT